MHHLKCANLCLHIFHLHINVWKLSGVFFLYFLLFSITYPLTAMCSIIYISRNNMNLHELTPWSRVLLEKLIGSWLVKKLSTFYRTQQFITAFTTAHHLSLSWARSIQSMPPHPTSWRIQCPFSISEVVPKHQSNAKAITNFCKIAIFYSEDC